MGKVAEISLDLKPMTVQDSVTVTATANEERNDLCFSIRNYHIQHAAERAEPGRPH